jgi:alpha/beta superfamily hydrolase
MRAATRRERVRGPAGWIECAVDAPAGTARGLALVAHPHPQYGGTLDNKVVQTLARALVELGYEAWRPNFRGVGESDGGYDEGRGETDDLLAVLRHVDAARVVLAGFSFGAAMQARVGKQVAHEWMVLVGVAVSRFETPQVQPGTLVIHGENDATVALPAVLDWARPQELPVVLVPGADHFFHRKLQVLKQLVLSNGPRP